WLAAIATEYLVLARFFASDLDAGARGRPAVQQAGAPVFVLVTVAATLAGFVAASAAGVNPAGAAFARAAGGAAPARRPRRPAAPAVGRSAALPFLAFVLGLGVVVQAVVTNGLGRALGPLVPGGTSLPALLATAALSAALANLINNLPAVLVLLPLA